MTDADILRRQMATSTDPGRLSREALRAEIVEAVDYMTDIATSQHAWDDPVGRHYHLIVIAARAYLETLDAGLSEPPFTGVSG